MADGLDLPAPPPASASRRPGCTHRYEFNCQRTAGSDVLLVLRSPDQIGTKDGRLNSFGTLRHHPDVASLLLTVVHLSLSLFLISFRETKNPAYVAVSRVGKFYGSYDRITCLPKAYRGYTQSDVYSDHLVGSG